MRDEAIKHTVDAAAAGVTIGAVLGYLPAIAAVFTIIWTGIRIYESQTAQKLLSKLRGLR